MSYSENQRQSVWEKGRLASNNDPAVWRMDRCGAWFRRDHYGRTDYEYGWEIDHLVPQSRGGSDELANLQPLQWENNRAKQDQGLDCVVTSSDVHNKRRS